MTYRLVLHALALAFLLVVVGPVSAGGQWGWVRDVVAERASAWGVSSWVLIETARCESGFNPHAIGDRGLSLGLFQLHAYGLRPAFWRLGYTNIWSPWQQSDFTARMFAHGYARHWSCYRILIGEWR